MMVVMPRSLVSFSGSLMLLPEALMGSFHVDEGEP
jgi:hypothetical protein